MVTCRRLVSKPRSSVTARSGPRWVWAQRSGRPPGPPAGDGVDPLLALVHQDVVDAQAHGRAAGSGGFPCARDAHHGTLPGWQIKMRTASRANPGMPTHAPRLPQDSCCGQRGPGSQAAVR